MIPHVKVVGAALACLLSIPASAELPPIPETFEALEPYCGSGDKSISAVYLNGYCEGLVEGAVSQLLAVNKAVKGDIGSYRICFDPSPFPMEVVLKAISTHPELGLMKRRPAAAITVGAIIGYACKSP